MKFSCAHCGKTADRPTGHVNRSRAQGLNLYCGRRCAGRAHRKGKTKAQRIEEKRLYDAEYRRRNLVLLKEKKRAYFKRTYDPAKARIERRKRAKAHAEYCRRPEYKRWKCEYDRQHRAREYGPFADAYQLTLALNREIKSRSTDYEIRQANQTGNKAQKRAREGGEKQGRRNHPPAYGL